MCSRHGGLIHSPSQFRWKKGVASNGLCNDLLLLKNKHKINSFVVVTPQHSRLDIFLFGLCSVCTKFNYALVMDQKKIFVPGRLSVVIDIKYHFYGFLLTLKFVMYISGHPKRFSKYVATYNETTQN